MRSLEGYIVPATVTLLLHAALLAALTMNWQSSQEPLVKPAPRHVKARIVSLEGRSDDMLVLPGRRGPVRIHPIHVRGPLAAEASVLQYQVVHRGAELDVACILARDAPPGTLDRVARTLTDALRARDAEVAIAVRAVTEMPRSGAGKLALVRSEPFAPVGATPGKTWI